MDELRQYINSLPTTEQHAFAERCETTLGYLRKAISTGTRFEISLVINIERESGGTVRCEALRPDVDWIYLRKRKASAPLPQSIAG